MIRLAEHSGSGSQPRQSRSERVRATFLSPVAGSATVFPRFGLLELPSPTYTEQLRGGDRA